MKLTFPEGFIWGTSTAAAQIETAVNHNWVGLQSKDGYTFKRTADHELRRDEDVEYIAQLGQAYRMSAAWWRLQEAPFAPFNIEVVNEYRSFMGKLKARNMYIMFVLHHFTNPIWFENEGSWENPMVVPMFIDYVKKVVKHFGDLIDNWNTFNEPAVYLVNSRLMGSFPPKKKNIFHLWKALKNMSNAHKKSVKVLKNHNTNIPIGISKNTVIYKAQNVLGVIPAYLIDKLFMEIIADHFVEGCDYWGMSYYAKIRLGPNPISEVHSPGKLDKMGIKHDKMWEYYPKGMQESMERYHKRYGLPFIITENGICTDDCQERISSINDYLGLLHQSIQNGIEVLGYFHWTTMDNFEWDLGPTYRFGLVHVNFETGDRQMKESGKYYQQVVTQNGIET